MTVIHALPAPEYHAQRALSAGMIHTFDAECPAKAYRASPWNPNRKPTNASHFDIGTAAHLATLEPTELSNRVVVHGFDDYRTKEARSIRDDAWAEGLTPLKPAEWESVQEIARAIDNSDAASLFQRGNGEVTMRWEWSGLPCKLRADYLPDSCEYLVDLKTCRSANPEAFSRAVWNFGYHIRAAWYLAGAEAAMTVRPEHYYFVCVEVEPVGLVTVYELDAGALHRGDQIIARTIPRIGECLASGEWPGYAGGVIGLPSWSEFRLADREEAGDFQ